MMFPVILALRADLIMLVIETYKLLSEAVCPKFSGSMIIEIFLHLSDLSRVVQIFFRFHLIRFI